MTIWQRFSRQTRKEYSPRARLTAMACEGLVFVLAIPAALLWLAAGSGERWRFTLSPVLLALCLLLAALGLALAFWTVWAQFHHARGTPVPIMATQKLLTDGPYSFCRNPMALGTLVFYFCIAIVTSSLKPLLVVAIFTVCLLLYIKLIEEKEMEQRFGQEYSYYRQSTPFLIPRLWPFRRNRKG